MHERERYHLATIAAETAYNLLELEAQQEQPDLDEMMCRLKDLSAYSLTHAEIMDQREGIELLALARFFGMSSDQRLWKNQERLYLAFYGDGLRYHYTKVVPHDRQQWQYLDELMDQAMEHWEGIPPEQRDYDRAKEEYVRRSR